MLAFAERVYARLIWFGLAVATGFVVWVSLAPRVPPSSAVAAGVPEPDKPRPRDLLAELIPENGVVRSGRFPWPNGGVSVLVDEHAGNTRWTSLVWIVGERGDVIKLPGEADKAVIRDVVGDQDSELVIFAKPPAARPELSNEATAWIWGSSDGAPERMSDRELQLIGATDEASLDRELAATTLVQTAETSPLKLIARLSLATPKEMRALIGPKGLKLCHIVLNPKTGVWMAPRCRTVPEKNLEKEAVAEILSRAKHELDGLVCAPDKHRPTRVDCDRFEEGEETNWQFERIDGMLRLVKLSGYFGPRIDAACWRWHACPPVE